MTSTVEYTSPGQRFARADLVALIQQQVVRVAGLRAQISAGLPVTGDLATELRELELLQDRLDL
ncbi:hypothetical protein OJ997_29150 [Solirubrobacter phytolaccae]|uniref:Uncharacterized protein n=1 Tax=Solirubrobacter phytolaccae TaxID=1404360 RepID=A0A9X3NMX9_9ACTN|nr:hypothetical protein [Solirubrobacter phytolaccae]MDA0184407.1 hypothetical protein [Solirubrobacter phytolaccae]